MFEKAKPVSASARLAATGLRADDSPHARRPASVMAGERFDARTLRRAGDALRAVEWSELTARLNAARDLRLLMRHESQTNIEDVAASFGDAAASYFALLGESERDVNPDALGRSKALDGMIANNETARPANQAAGAARGDAREMQ